jgi:lipoprotein-anchoring transpeptidase ErfK/SrfK
MSRHRAERPRPVRARYGRIAAAAIALLVTAVALLGGIGIIPIQTNSDAADTNPSAGPAQGASTPEGSTSGQRTTPKATTTNTTTNTTKTSTQQGTQQTTSRSPAALPSGTGTGRRVVFSESAQRVWLVGANNGVLASYLVSGSLTDNLHPGTYSVYSRSRWAVGVDDSGVMQYFVRFTRGNNAPIGFHSIPTKNGTPLQTIAQLGTPRSHGCIRQKLADAQRMWAFAPVGTRVVVV